MFASLPKSFGVLPTIISFAICTVPFNLAASQSIENEQRLQNHLKWLSLDSESLFYHSSFTLAFGKVPSGPTYLRFKDQIDETHWDIDPETGIARNFTASNFGSMLHMFRPMKKRTLKMYYGGDHVAKLGKGELDGRDLHVITKFGRDMTENFGTLFMLPLMNENNVEEEVWTKAREKYDYDELDSKIRKNPDLIKNPILKAFFNRYSSEATARQNSIFDEKANRILNQLFPGKFNASNPNNVAVRAHSYEQHLVKLLRFFAVPLGNDGEMLNGGKLLADIVCKLLDGYDGALNIEMMEVILCDPQSVLEPTNVPPREGKSPIRPFHDGRDEEIQKSADQYLSVLLQEWVKRGLIDESEYPLYADSFLFQN